MSLEKFKDINEKISSKRDYIDTHARSLLMDDMDRYLISAQLIHHKATKKIDKILKDHPAIPEGVGIELKSLLKDMGDTANSIRDNYNDCIKIFENFDNLNKEYMTLINNSDVLEEKQLTDILEKFNDIEISLQQAAEKLSQDKIDFEKNNFETMNRTSLLMNSVAKVLTDFAEKLKAKIPDINILEEK